MSCLAVCIAKIERPPLAIFTIRTLPILLQSQLFPLGTKRFNTKLLFQVVRKRENTAKEMERDLRSGSNHLQNQFWQYVQLEHLLLSQAS